MGGKIRNIILTVAIILFMLSCSDDADYDIYWNTNSAYTGYYIMILDTTDIGAQCDPGEIPPTPTRIEFGDVTVDWNYDLFFDSLGLFNGDTVLIDFWGDLWENRMELVSAGRDTITFYVVHFEGGDTIWGIFWWNTTGDCVVEGTFIVLIE